MIAAFAAVVAAARVALAGEPPGDKSLYSLFDPTPDSALRSFSTDRPPKANSAYTVDAGHFQYETDVAVYGFGRSNGTRTRDWTVIDPTLKLGLTNTLDAELQITPYQSIETTFGDRTTRVWGVGDTYARLKFNVVGDDGGQIAIALLPYVKLPTARASLGNGKIEGGLILPVTINAPGGFVIVVMPQVEALKNNTNGGYHPAADFLVNISHAVSKRWVLYSEVFTTQSFQKEDRPIYTLDEALTYAITPTFQLDFGGNFGLNGVQPQIQLYTGLSQRF